LALTKFLLLTDALIDLHDFPRVLEHVLARVRWESDFFIFANTSMDTLDYTSGKVNQGSKAILMGLAKLCAICPANFAQNCQTGLRAQKFLRRLPGRPGNSYEDDNDQAARLAKSRLR
jgi:3-polyprenyl-4-hydroxybenzoate decarboxylase